MARTVGRRLNTRLDHLQTTLRPVGCATCRVWTGVLLVGEDGPHRPRVCPDCGRDVPVTVTLRLHDIQIALI